MTRKHAVIGTVVGLAALVALWLWHRHGHEGAKPSAPAAKTAHPVAPSGERPSEPSGELRVLADDDPTGSLRLEGLVLDSGDQPVPGAIVTVDANPPRVATTEQDGSFFFDKLVAREYTLVARAKAGVAGPVTARLNDKNPPVILHLEPASRVEVTVVDAADQQPIEGAAVELRGLDHLTGATDHAGVARLEGVVADDYVVVAAASGFAKQYGSVRVAGSAATAKLTVALRRGAEVVGRVIDQAGAAVAGATVMYSGASEWSQQADEHLDGVVTGADGGFRFDALPAGSFRFVAKKPSFAPGMSELVTLDGSSARSGIEIKLEPGAVLTGHVVSKAGAPVPAARIRVRVAARSMFLGDARQAYADDQGAFRVDGLPRAALEVVAMSDEAASDALPVDLAGKATRDVTITLAIDGRIAGVVVAKTGEPIEGAQVMAFPDFGKGGQQRMGGFRLRGMPDALSDADGHFELTGLEDGDYEVRANPPGVEGRGSAFLRDPVPAHTGALDLRIVLAKDGGIKGKVAFKNGEVPDLFTVSVGFRGQPFSAKDGGFTVDHLPAKSFTVSVRGPGFDARNVPDVVVKEGEVTDLGTITVSKGRTIAGKVVTADGQPVKDALIRAGRMVFGDGSTSKASFGGPPQARSTKETRSDENGEFVLYGVGRGDLSIVAEHDTLGRSSSIRLLGSDQSITGLTLALLPFGALEGTVSKDGQPLGEVIVTASPLATPGSIYSVATGTDGKFRYDHLAPDQYKVSAMAGKSPMMGFGFHSKAATVVSGQTAHVDLVVEAGKVELTILLKEKTGKALNFTWLTLATGQVTAQTVRELQGKVGAMADGYSHQAFSIRGSPAKIQELAAASYTVCAAPYPVEVKGMQETMDYGDREGDNLPVFCQKVDVTGSATEQSATIEVTAPKYVPPPPDPG